MPLRAVVEATQAAVIAPFLSDAEWAALGRAVQSGTTRLLLPCCDGGAYLRTSPRGLKHFAHLPNHTGCASAQHETLEHLRAKAEIALACRADGYQVFIEHPYGEWRADVYAEKDGRKLAFEVQWSAQTLAETARRHVRYARDDVRDWWFFRRLPVDYQPGGDLPAFALEVDEGETSGVQFERRLGGDHVHVETYPLRDFVGAVLNRRLRFCAHARARAAQEIDVTFCYTRCYRCKQIVYVYTVGNPVTDCGLELRLTPTARLKLGFADEVRQAVRQSAGGERLRISDNGRQFRCPNCGAEQKDERVIETAERVRQGTGDVTARARFAISLAAPPTAVFPHWCFPRSGGWCCD